MISVLYVDDEKTLLDVTRVWLEMTGDFTVTTTTSAKDAIDLLGTRAFDAIVADYQMPVMDGLVFLQHLRQEGNAVPFILFTGKGREEVAIEALNSGADFYLQKGGEPKSQFAELANKIRQAVQRRHAEKALKASEEKYRDLVENINDVIYTVSADGILTYISPVVSQFGYTPDDMIGKPMSAYIEAEDLPRIEARFEEIEHGILGPHEFRIRDGNGIPRYVRTSSRPVLAGGKFSGVHGVLTDITSQKAAEEKVMASEQRYRDVFEAAGDAMLVVDGNSGTILDANRSASYLFGCTAEELKGMSHDRLLAERKPEDEDFRTGIFGSGLRWYHTREGTVFPAAVLSSEYSRKNHTISILSIRNMADEIRAEERVFAAQRLYAVLSQINQAIVRVKDLKVLLSEICRISVEFGKFRMAWVGLLDRDTSVLRPVASAGHEEGYLAATKTPGSDEMQRMSPAGTAIHEGHFCVCNDIGTDPRMEPWKGEAQKRGYASMAAFPFRLNGEVIGAFVLFASRKDFFDTTEAVLLEEVAMDISFALDMLDEQARRTKAEKELAESLKKERTLAAILELSSQPFGIGYPDGRFGIVNPALCDLLGYSEEELATLSWKMLTAPGFAEREDAALHTLFQTGVPQRYEKEFIRKDSSRVPVEMFVHRVTDEQGDVRYLYSFVTDITGRRQAEEAVRKERDLAQHYLDVAGVMLGVLDTEGTIALINRKGCDILGYEEDDLTGRDWIATCLPERAREEVRGVFAQVRSGDVAPVEYHENPVLTKDGQERLIAFHNTVLLDDAGQVTGILFSGEDITDRRRMEAALQESELRFRSLIQNAADMIHIIGRDGLFTYSSPSTLRITGYSPEEVIGKDPSGFVHPEDREHVMAALSEVTTRGSLEHPAEYRIRHADGTYIDVETVATSLADLPGVAGIVITTRPVTERKSAERALRESEWRYRALFEKSADAILVLDRVFTDCNPQAERMFACSREEILGKTPADLSPPEQPGGRLSADLAGDHILAAGQGTPRTFSWVHSTAAGRPFPAMVTLIPAQSDEKDRLIVIVHDCSGRDARDRQSRHLARFPEMNPDPVIEVRRDREIVYANPAARTVLRSLGMPEDPAAFLPEDFDAVVIAIQAETAPSLHRVIRIGTALYCEVLSYDRESSTIRIFAHDITTRSFEKNALEQAIRKLNLLSHITRHDIKNKLTGVMGYLELARGTARDPEMIEYISRAEISANAVRQQIEFTKGYENLGIQTPVWQDVSRVLANATALLDRGAVTVQDEVKGLCIYADPMFEKVLYCLLENAVSHGEKITRVRIFGEPTESGYLLVVEDDGVGVPDDRKEKIFNKKVGKESGIGLYLSREVLSITGITIEEKGVSGNGARFEMTVPSGKFQIKSPE